MSSKQQPTTERPERYEIPEPMARLLIARQDELNELEQLAAEAQAEAQAAYTRLAETLTAAAELVAAPTDYVCKNIYAGFTAPETPADRIEELAQETRKRHQSDRIQRAAAGILAQAIPPASAAINGKERPTDEA